MRLQEWNLALVDRTKNRNCALANASGSVSLFEKKGIFQNNFLRRRSFRINSTEFSAAKTPTADITTPIVARNESSPWRFALIDITLPTQTTSTWLRRWFVLAVEFQLRLLVVSVVKISTWAMALPCQKVAFARDSFWPKLLLFSNVTRLAVKFPADKLESSSIRRC